jgi:hypothetical protein
VAEQADAADLKSAARKGIRVRISAPAPSELVNFTAYVVTTTVGAFLASWLDASRQRIRHSTWQGYESGVRVF